MRIAFYAPLKPPDHPVPSGDRQVAQLFLKALRLAGHEPVLASRFRSFEGRGDGQRQARLAVLGRRLADRSLRRYRQTPMAAPELWFTYHLYHKAPDWLGPRISTALEIPYVVAEASFAPKQAGGPWMIGHRAAEQGYPACRCGDRAQPRRPCLRFAVTGRPVALGWRYGRSSMPAASGPRAVTDEPSAAADYGGDDASR